MDGFLKKLFNSKLFCLLILFSFIEPQYFTQLPSVDQVYSIFKLLSIGIILFMIILSPIINKFSVSIFLFLLLDIFATIFSDGQVNQMVINALTIITLVSIMFYSNKYDSLNFLWSARLIFDLLIIINFVSMILYPEGLYNFESINAHYFLGHRNVMMRTLYPGVFFDLMYRIKKNNKLSFFNIIIILIVGASIFMAWAATAIVSYILFLLLFIIFYRRQSRLCSIKGSIILSLIIFITLVLFRIQDIFSFLIEDVLKKDMTFTGRTYLWDAIMKHFGDSPLIGNGLENLETISAKLFSFTVYDSAHNFYLDTIYQNGIIGFAIILFVFISFAFIVDSNVSGKMKALMVSIMFGYAIMVNFEPFINGDFRWFISVVAFMYSFGYRRSKKAAVESGVIYGMQS